MPGQKFEAEALERFLETVDSELDAPTAIIVIGGPAISLVYAPRYGTDDIDTWSGHIDEGVLERARKKSGLAIPLKPAGVADAPYTFEDRVQKLELGLERLTIFTPERPGHHEGRPRLGERPPEPGGGSQGRAIRPSDPHRPVQGNRRHHGEVEVPAQLSVLHRADPRWRRPPTRSRRA